MSNRLITIAGCAALTSYIALFAAGMFVDSKDYRDHLARRSVVLAAAAPVDGAFVPAVSAAPPVPISTLEAFVKSLLLYTPTNVAVLTLLAGFLGGCASCITFARTQNENSDVDPAKADVRAVGSELFRTESPFASMFRSLLVYLAFITGLFITTTDPFQNPTPDQYVRFAGTISFFAFVVGYDPTKFQSFLELLPRRAK